MNMRIHEDKASNPNTGLSPDPLNYTQPSLSISRKGHPHDARRKDKQLTITIRYNTFAKDLLAFDGQYKSSR